jgi:hypothetical protein
MHVLLGDVQLTVLSANFCENALVDMCKALMKDGTQVRGVPPTKWTAERRLCPDAEETLAQFVRPERQCQLWSLDVQKAREMRAVGQRLERPEAKA